MTHPAKKTINVLVVQPRKENLASTDFTLRQLLPECKVDFVNGLAYAFAQLGRKPYAVIIVDFAAGDTLQNASSIIAIVTGQAPGTKLALFADLEINPQTIGADTLVRKADGQNALARETIRLAGHDQTAA